MHARTLAYRLLLMGPVLFIGSIAIHARIATPSWDFPSCNQRQQAAIGAYRPFLCAALPFRDQRSNQVDQLKLRAVAQSWIDGRKVGTLLPLTPAYMGDSVRDGIKQQIRQGESTLVAHLQELARNELINGQPKRACDDVMLALRVSEVLKYSDPYSVSMSGMEQRASIKILDSISPNLPAFDLGKLVVELEQFRSQQHSLDPIVRLARQLYRQAKQRRGEPVSDIQEVDLFLAESQGAADRGLNMFRDVHPVLASASDTMPVISTIRMATGSQAALLRRLDHAITTVLAQSVIKNPEKSRLVASAP